MAHSRYVPDAAETLGAGAPAAEHAAQQRFDSLLRRRPRRGCRDDWTAIRDAHVAYATAPNVGDPRAHFLELLGLEAVSATAAYRFAVNVAGRHGVASRGRRAAVRHPAEQLVGRTADRRAVRAVRAARALRAGPRDGVRRRSHRAAARRRGRSRPRTPTVYRRVEDSRAYELRLLDRQPRAAGLARRNRPGGRGRRRCSPPRPPPWPRETRTDERHRSLLLLLARHALLVVLRDAALRMLVAEGLLTEDDVILAGASIELRRRVAAPPPRR